MTVEELYEFAKENNALNYEIAVPFGKHYRSLDRYFVFKAAIDKNVKCVIVGESQREYDEKLNIWRK